MDRRRFMIGAAALLATRAFANVPTPYDWDVSPPRQSRDAFVAWMVRNRGEDPRFLEQRWDRLQQIIAHRDIWDEADIRAYLLTPREEFVTPENLERAYEPQYRLRRDDHRSAHGRAHDERPQRQTQRQGARNRHRLGVPVGLSRESHAARLLDRDHPSAGRAHPRLV